jgi:DNA polymerase (family 10)
VAAAKAEGLEYFSITDHSVSSTVANGLDQKRLLEQVKLVRELDAEVEGITVLAGSEVDIRRNGTLDFPDEILAQLDIVVASVHSHFNLTEAEMTKRIVRAIEHPFVNIIGHPTGRMLGRRPMYPVNLEEVIAAAAENDTVLEINGSPSRLDLDSQFVRMAKDAGVLLAVNTDAHAIRQLAHRQSGLNVARRGWLTKADVINTYTLEALREQCGIGVPS